MTERKNTGLEEILMQDIIIDAKSKELYYKATKDKTSKNEIEKRYDFWNYMLNVSVQNVSFHKAKKAMQP